MPENDPGAAGPAPECQTCPSAPAWPPCARPGRRRSSTSSRPGAELLLAAKALLDGAEPTGTPALGRRRARPAGTGDAAAGNGLQRIDIG